MLKSRMDNFFQNDLMKFFGFSIIAQIIAYQAHELGHFLVGLFMGIEQRYVLTGVFHSELSANQQLLHSLGGPVVTLIFSIIALLYLINSKKVNSFLVALVYGNAFLRIQPMVQGLITGKMSYQDEAKIAHGLGLSPTMLGLISLIIFLIIFIVGFFNSGKKKLFKVPIFIVGSGLSAFIISSLASWLSIKPQ